MNPTPPPPNDSGELPPKIHLLLIDDQPLVAAAVKRLLADEKDIQLHYCSDASDVLSQAETIRPSVILQDLVMPNIDGLDLVRRFRENALTREVPIVVLSSEENPEIKSRSFDSGANDYLVKLPHKAELIARVRYHSRAYRNQIERDIARRELIAANQSLIEANKQLAKATQAKSEFLANMSHEIRTPMNGVLGMTAVLEATDLTEEQRDLADTLRLSAEALLTIINDILDFSKIESGSMDIESAPFDLRDCVEGALLLMAPKAREKNLDLVYRMTPETPTRVVGDITRLRQILVNLINNAVKFTPRGEVCVTLAPEALEPGSAAFTLHFCVRDTGIGIPVEKQDRLFKYFSQVDSSTTREFGGTGLGLAICKRLCELMNGRIWVESQAGRGSLFEFTVRLDREANLGTDHGNLFEGKKGTRLLILEDNQTTCDFVTEETRTWGISTTIAHTVEETFRLLENGPGFDALLLDHQLPGLDEPQIIALLTRIRSRNNGVLILLSSTRVKPEDPALQHWSVASVLQKPIRRNALADALNKALASRTSDTRSAPERSSFDQSLANRLPLRILLVDDNVVNQKVGSKLLERMGFKPQIAANGREALEILDNRKIDLVFMDVQMPELDGYETTRQMCERWQNDRPVVIAMTGSAMVGDREKCLEAGMDDYITKPVRPEVVQNILETWGTGALGRSSHAPGSDSQTARETGMAVEDGIDLDRLPQLVGGDPDALMEITSDFLQQTELQLRELLAAIRRNEASNVYQIAHKAVGACFTVGTSALANSLRKLELEAQQGDLRNAENLLAAATARFERTREVMKKKFLPS